MNDEIYPKKELFRRVEAFFADPARVMSTTLFAELCGYEKNTIDKAFKWKSIEVSEAMQIRVSKALQMIARGEVSVMKGAQGVRYLEYNKQPKPRLYRSYNLKVDDGKIGLDVGIKTRHNYEKPAFNDAMFNYRGK
jgi:hypothetical protein